MNNHDLDTEDQALRTLLRPALAELIDEAASQSSVEPGWYPFPLRVDDRTGDPAQRDIHGDADNASGGFGTPAGRRRVLALAAAVLMLVGGAVALGRQRDQSVRTAASEPTTVPPTSLSGDPMPPVGEQVHTLGGLRPDAAFSGRYAVVEPRLAPEFEGVRPVTISNIDRWLYQPAGAELHWMVPIDNVERDTDVPAVSWRAPVPAPPEYVIDPGKTPKQASEAAGRLLTIQTRDRSWVEVNLGTDESGEFDEWVASLGSLATATDIAPPQGYTAVPQPVEEIGLRYTLTGTAEQAGSTNTSDENESTVVAQLDEAELPTLDLITVRFDDPISEIDALNWFSMWGKPEAVEEFSGEGELYRIREREPDEDVSAPIDYGWLVSSDTLVWIRAAETTVERADHHLAGLALTEGPPEAALLNDFSDGQLTADTEVTRFRSGEFESYRFVYVETPRTQSSDRWACGYFVVGAPWPPHECLPVPAESGTDLCVYRVDPAGDVLSREAEGYVFTLLVDAGVADRVSVTTGGGAAASDTSGATDVSIAEPVVGASPGSSTEDGRPLLTEEIVGQTDGHDWVARTARVATAPTVTGDGIECTQMS